MVISSGDMAHREPRVQRIAIVDACNVMADCRLGNCQDITGHGGQIDGSFEKIPGNALRVLAMMNLLVAEDFDVQMFIPASFLNNRTVFHRHVIEYLEKLCVVTMIHDHSHDDLVMLEAARALGGFVVSEDKFAQHHEDHPKLRKVIEERVVGFGITRRPFNQIRLDTNEGCFSTGFDVTLHPKSASARYAFPGDPTFETVQHHRRMRNPQRVKLIRRELGIMTDFLQQEACVVNGKKPPKLAYFNPEMEALPTSYDKFREKVPPPAQTLTSPSPAQTFVSLMD